ncbi:hypothetical protein BKA64DRAFT_7107 [Cadophora sp. MPI-SDFR-AT-0126]|nr:hypothetical protein BKA64DRAFT_7107 [Leotiomycetes sp. MPI-SDFR-AT-0126]
MFLELLIFGLTVIVLLSAKSSCNSAIVYTPASLNPTQSMLLNSLFAPLNGVREPPGSSPIMPKQRAQLRLFFLTLDMCHTKVNSIRRGMLTPRTSYSSAVKATPELLGVPM